MGPSQGTCFKVLYGRSKRLAPFAEEQNAKLQSELPENRAKRVNVENQRTEVIYKKSWSYNFCHIYRKAPVLESLFNAVTVERNCSTKGAAQKRKYIK